MATDDHGEARARFVAGVERFLRAHLPPDKRPPPTPQGRMIALADDLACAGEWRLAFIVVAACTARRCGSDDALAGLCLQFCEAVGRVPGQGALAALAAPVEPEEAP